MYGLREHDGAYEIVVEESGRFVARLEAHPHDAKRVFELVVAGLEHERSLAESEGEGDDDV